MIDEKKLFELIREYSYPITQFNNSIEIGMTLSGIKQVIDEQPKIGEWIPCSERLPEEPEEISTEEKFIEEMILDGKLKEYIVMIYGADEATTLYYTGNNEWYDAISSEYYKVVAWQPLPEPYIGEQHEG